MLTRTRLLDKGQLPPAIGMGWSWSRFFSTVMAFFRWLFGRVAEEPDLSEPIEQALPPAKVPGPTPIAPQPTEKLEPALSSRDVGKTMEGREVEKEPAFSMSGGDWEESQPPQVLVGDEDITMKMLGVPSWSNKDDPRNSVKHHPLTQEEADEEAPLGTVGVPSWSILDGSIDAVEESPSDGMEPWEEPKPREPDSLEELELEEVEPPSPPSSPAPERLSPPLEDLVVRARAPRSRFLRSRLP